MTSTFTRGFRTPRLNFRPGHYAESVNLDRDESVAIPPYVGWHDFQRQFDFRQGEHVTLVAVTQSGKTTLARKLILPRRDYVCVLGTKPRDKNLYPPLEAEGYEITQEFDPTPEPNDPHKVIFAPMLDKPTREAKQLQADAFLAVLIDIYRYGGWCLYADEIRYLTGQLGLRDEFETLWLQGATLGVSIVAATQEPVHVPLEAFGMATHLFLFRTTDKRRVQRASEFGGADVDVVNYVLPRLPQYEFLYVNTRDGTMMRSRALL